VCGEEDSRNDIHDSTLMGGRSLEESSFMTTARQNEILLGKEKHIKIQIVERQIAPVSVTVSIAT
jgi:hypothetical protein